MPRGVLLVVLVAVLAVLGGGGTEAADVSVAVAANFTGPAKEIAEKFEAESGTHVSLSFGSTGQIYAQIVQGAPFDAFLSADRVRPQRLVEDGLALPETRLTYAVGRLVLWRPETEPGRPGGAELLNGDFEHLAIANPDIAPYGAAAVSVLKELGLANKLGPRLVKGATIAQTYQFVSSGNAELGFVARAQIVGDGRGATWLVPASMHPSILQDAVLLSGARGNAAAEAFLRFLVGPAAADIVARYGYDRPLEM